MRRYTALLLTAFVLLLLAAAGSSYLAGRDRTESHAPLMELTAYTTLPAEHASILAEAYETAHRIRVTFVPLTSAELMNKLQTDVEQGRHGADLVLADREVLLQAAAKGYFQPYISEQNDAVRPHFKDENGHWTGVWYDPIVFCVNRDYLKTLSMIPDTWTALAEFPDVRIGITDFLAADASGNLMYQMIGQYGDAAAYQILRGLHPKVIQYAKYLSNPVRQAGMGEADISIAVASETMRYIHDGYPLKIIYPADGTAWLLTGSAVPLGTSGMEQSEAQLFADWLLSDEAQIALQAKNFFFLPTNPGTMAYKRFAGKNLVLYQQLPLFTAGQKHEFLDRWVKHIRLQ
ncbi:MAG: extracellular solute-binding protein [Selenomonadaceae bacterium]|nr:extracellular solute-binding protein [Selenomonadaceae bacterium]